MKTTAVHLREVCSKKAKFASCVENPPIEIVDFSVSSNQLGDVNMDSSIDVLDVVLLLNFILEYINPTEDQIWLSDLNQDGILNVLDIISLVNIILN